MIYASSWNRYSHWNIDDKLHIVYDWDLETLSLVRELNIAANHIAIPEDLKRIIRVIWNAKEIKNEI